jgi:hypothetical protein
MACRDDERDDLIEVIPGALRRPLTNVNIKPGSEEYQYVQNSKAQCREGRVEGRIKTIGDLQGIAGGLARLRGKALQAVQLVVRVQRADKKMVDVLLKGSTALTVYCQAIKGDNLKAAGVFQETGDKKVFLATRASCSARKPARRRKA